MKQERGRGEDCIKRAFAVERRDRGSNVPKSSLAVLIYRVVSVILMRKVRLLGRGRGKLLPILPRRWGGLGHVTVTVRRRILLRRAPGSITLLVKRLLIGIMRRIPTVGGGGRGCIVFHWLRRVHGVAVRWRGKLLRITVAAHRSAIKAASGCRKILLFTGRCACGSRTRGRNRFGGTNWRIN